jgi:peptidoglycan-N-acetylglucosamine deacetylase
MPPEHAVPGRRSWRRWRPWRPWRCSPLTLASMLVHLAALALLLRDWHAWPWVIAVLVLNHLLFVALGLTPRSHLLGSNWTRLPAAGSAGRIALTLDDGPDPVVTPAVLRILAEHGARATFFCIGERARRHPALVQACIAGGHAVENHSDRHPVTFSLLGPSALTREISQAQQTLQLLSGQTPRFFRAPAGLRSPLLDPVLQRLGLQLASWTRRGFDTVTADAERVLARLTRRLSAGDILLLHDGNAALDRGGHPVLLTVLPQLLTVLRQRGLTPVTLRELLP